MSSHSDTSLAALLLTQRLVETAAQPLKASEYWAVLDKVHDPATLLGLQRPVLPRLEPLGRYALPRQTWRLPSASRPRSAVMRPFARPRPRRARSS